MWSSLWDAVKLSMLNPIMLMNKISIPSMKAGMTCLPSKNII